MVCLWSNLCQIKRGYSSQGRTSKSRFPLGSVFVGLPALNVKQSFVLLGHMCVVEVV